MWRSFKFSWQNFLLGALCGAIVMAGAWWRSTQQVDDWVSVEDRDTDRCLASDKTTAACDAFMRVLARAKVEDAANQAKYAAEQEKIKQEVEKRLAEGATKLEIVKWVCDTSLSYAQMSAVLGISVDFNECRKAKVKQKPEFDPNKPFVAVPNGPWDAYKPQPDSRPPLESFVVKPDEASR
jgi:hypothetical protein